MMLNQIISEIKRADRIAILPHVSADGDALGSSSALAMALRKLNKEAVIFLEENVPSYLGFIPNINTARIFSLEENENYRKFSLVISLDSGDLERLGKRQRIFQSANTTINIDHHATNTQFANLNYVQSGASSVGEIIYQLIKLIGLDLNADISTCLYVALSTDTGGFRYSNTTSITHQIAAELINHGVKVAEISQQLFENTSLERIRVMGLVINSLELHKNSKVSLTEITDAMLMSVGARDEDCEGFVNLGRSIRGVEVAIMLREKVKGEIRVNLRSKSYADVSIVASKLGGGGHKMAAGCTIKGTMEEAKKLILSEIYSIITE